MSTVPRPAQGWESGQGDRGTEAGLETTGLPVCHGNWGTCHLFGRLALVTKSRQCKSVARELIL